MNIFFQRMNFYLILNPPKKGESLTVEQPVHCDWCAGVWMNWNEKCRYRIFILDYFCLYVFPLSSLCIDLTCRVNECKHISKSKWVKAMCPAILCLELIHCFVLAFFHFFSFLCIFFTVRSSDYGHKNCLATKKRKPKHLSNILS